MSPAAQLVEAMMQMRELGSSVLAAVDGHRAEAERRGFGSDVCDQMAAQFHYFLLDTIMQRRK